MTLELILSSFCLLLVLMVKHHGKKLRTATKKSINLYTCNNGAPCTRIFLHFIHILWRIFRSSVFKSFGNTIFIFIKFGNLWSSFFNLWENWVLHIFILHQRVKDIFIFVFKLKLLSSNLPVNLQGAPIIQVFVSSMCSKRWAGSVKIYFAIIY